MLLGLAKGKVGDLVFYRDGGEQRTRTRVVPKNPRSAAQMGQRVRLANVPAFYRTMQAIMKDSFSNRPSNQSGYNAFAKGAIEMSPFLTKEMALAGSVLPAPYMVSRGVISSLPCETFVSNEQVYPALPLSNLPPNGVTIGGFSRLIISQYPQLQDGDILTFIAISFAVDEITDGADKYSAILGSAQFTLDTASTTVVTSSDLVGSSEYFVLPLNSAAENVAVTIIVSRGLSDGTLQTSTASLVLDEAASSLYENYRTEQALSEAVDSYGRGEESLLR